MTDQKPDPATEQLTQSEIVEKYTEVIAALAVCAAYVPETLRQHIEDLLDGAKEVVPTLTWRREGNDIRVEGGWVPTPEELAELDAASAEADRAAERGELIPSEVVLAEMDTMMEQLLAGRPPHIHVLPCPVAGHDHRTPCGCIREPAPGDVYVFTERAENPIGIRFHAGSPLVVVERTTLAPFGVLSARGYNWICEAANGRTVWSSIEALLHVGALRLVGTSYRPVAPEGETL